MASTSIGNCYKHRRGRSIVNLFLGLPTTISEPASVLPTPPLYITVTYSSIHNSLLLNVIFISNHILSSTTTAETQHLQSLTRSSRQVMSGCVTNVQIKTRLATENQGGEFRALKRFFSITTQESARSHEKPLTGLSCLDAECTLVPSRGLAEFTRSPSFHPQLPDRD